MLPVGNNSCRVNIVLKKWRLIRIDVKTCISAHHGPALRAAFIITPKESRQRGVVWLSLAAAYGLVNSNAKWQVQSKDTITSFGFIQSSAIPQLFLHFDTNCNVDVVLIKILDDILDNWDR